MPLSFPYPTQGSAVRLPGQGCQVCVHQTYCPAIYWLRRGGDYGGFRQEPINDSHLGRACTSWTTDLSQQVTETTAEDTAENTYMYNQDIQSEANRNGIVSPTTGGSRGG
jgi:hypothetical protein